MYTVKAENLGSEDIKKKENEMTRLMASLSDNAETLVNAVAVSRRNMRYGKEGKEFFESKADVTMILGFIYDDVCDLDADVWKTIKEAREDPDTDALKRLRKAVFSEVMKQIDLLANTDKAIESIAYLKWKENRDGYGEEGHYKDEDF